VSLSADDIVDRLDQLIERVDKLLDKKLGACCELHHPLNYPNCISPAQCEKLECGQCEEEIDEEVGDDTP
jgi:hypothetical protein